MRALIVDDHALLRGGIRNLLVSEPPFYEVFEADSAEEAIRSLRDNPPDVVILDINLPGRNGLNLLQNIRSTHPKLPVLIFSMHSEELYGVQAMRMGANGYVSKHAAPEEFLAAVAKVAGGGRYINANLAEKLLDSQLGGSEGMPHEQLSNREMEIMLLIAEGKTPARIAEALCISSTTANTYRARVLKKLGLKSNAEITRYAVESGLT